VIGFRSELPSNKKYTTQLRSTHKTNKKSKEQ
jgi:hypothetical protein